MRSVVTSILVGALILTTVGLPTAEAGEKFTIQGRLTDAAGAPVSGALRLTFRLYTSQYSASPMWSETHYPVMVQNGIYTVVLGDLNSLNLGQHTDYWIGISVESDSEMKPRVRLTRGHMTGPQGEKGDPGRDGVNGKDGATGAQGIQGPKGDKGDQGDRGSDGTNGKDGATGATGPKGDKGDKGATGATGAQGPKGDTGSKGATGDFPTSTTKSTSSTLFSIRNTGSGMALQVRASGSYPLFAWCESSSYPAIAAQGDKDDALYAWSSGGYALYGYSTKGIRSVLASGSGYDGFYTSVTSSGAFGVYAKSSSSYGVWAESSSGIGCVAQSSTNTGLLAGTQSSSQYSGYFSGGKGQYTSGSVYASGSKYFVERHPRDRGKAILYICMEGGEAGTYWRGSGRLQNGSARVDLPEHFRLVTGEEGLTVQVTPTAMCNGLFVVSRSPSHIEVRELGEGSSNATFDFLVQGVRRGWEGHEPITSDPVILDALYNDPLKSAEIRKLAETREKRAAVLRKRIK